MMANDNKYGGMSREELKNELADIDLELSERDLLDLMDRFVSATDSGDEDRILPVAEKLAEQVGNADAAEVAGEIHFKRKHIPEAAGFFKLGAARGNTRAMLFMAEFYNCGQIPCEDPKKEYYYWVKKASGLGDVQASYQLAYCYRDGIGVKRNRQKYRALLQEAADGGCADAVKELAQLLIIGDRSIKPDLVKSRALLQQLVDEGDGEAIFILACTYIDVDPQKCDALLRQAAAKKVPEAMALVY